MPSTPHEVLVDLLKSRPSLAAELLTEALGLTLPAYTEARVASADLTRIQPAEYRADLVVLLLDGDVPIHVLIVEVQLGKDPRKRITWPEYITGARATHGCPVTLLVVAPKPAVAAWCAQPIETGVPGFVLRPPVLGRDAVPLVTDTEEAARRPELGVLSVIAHGKSRRGAEIADAVLRAVRELDRAKATVYGDLVLDSVNAAARQVLEAKMIKGYEYKSDFAKKYYGQGRDAGLDEGRKEGERALLLRLLRARFGELPADVVARVEGAEVGTIERWGERVLSAKTLAEVLDEPS